MMMNRMEFEPSDAFADFDESDSEKPFVVEYISEWSAEELAIADTIASQITEHKPLPPTVVIIPVAAHAESNNIVPALDQYAKQTTSNPFAVHLHMNWPQAYANSELVGQSFDEVARAKELFPYLDIRVSQMEYGDDPKIGNIRRTAWNGTLLKLYQQDNYEEAIGINNDIDVLNLSRTYVENVQNFYSDFYQQELREIGTPTASTVVKHSFETEYSNSSKAIFWKDFSTRMFQGSYEAGMVIPMTTYALGDGFSANAATHETSRFVNHSLGPLPMIRGTSLTTSSRRFQERLHTNDYDTIWTNESFGANDDCRTTTDVEDISNDEMIRKVSEDATSFGADYIHYVLNWHLSIEEEDALISDDKELRAATEAEIYRRIRKTERMTRYVLDVALQIPRVGDFLSSQAFDKEYIEHQLYIKRMAIRKRHTELSKDFTRDWIAELVDFEEYKPNLQ
jgi:hypothetical protein